MRTYSPEFRLEEIIAATSKLERSKSVCIVGAASVGKSNFIAQLQSKLAASHDPQYLPIVLDANLLPVLADDVAQRCWAGHELILHRLYMSAYPFKMLDADAAEILFQTYQRLQDGRNPLYAQMAVRYLELAFKLFFQHGYRIVLLFDEFELFLRQMPLQFFLNLRGLRDMHKSALSYVVFARSTLPRLCERFGLPTADYEPFLELFNDSVQPLGPYNQRDAYAMMQALPNLSISIAKSIYEASGGFAGILRSIIEAVRDDPTVIHHLAFPAALLMHKAIRTECETLLQSLDQQELSLLRLLVSKQDISVDYEAAAELLVLKGIIRLVGDADYIIQPPLLHAYLTSSSS